MTLVISKKNSMMWCAQRTLPDNSFELLANSTIFIFF